MRNKQEQWAVLKRLLSYLKPYGLLTFLALAFLLTTTVIKSIIPLVASHFIDQYLNNLNQLDHYSFASLLWSLHSSNYCPICGESPFCARVLQHR